MPGYAVATNEIMCKPGSLADTIVSEYNRVSDACRAMTGTNRERLESLSMDDLRWFIAGKTLAFGRPADKALENAGLHVATAAKRARIIASYTSRDPERDSRIDR